MTERTTATGIRAGTRLSGADYEHVVRRAVFDCCRWNLVSGDTATLCPYPILVEASTWRALSSCAEALARETLAAEAEIAARPELHGELGLSAATRRAAIRAVRRSCPLHAIRFPSDARRLPHHGEQQRRLRRMDRGLWCGAARRPAVARLSPGRVAGDPAGALARALVDRAAGGIGLMHLSMYTDDRQVVSYLARRIGEAGGQAVLFDAAQLRGASAIEVAGERIDLALLFRFFPADWLERLPARTDWPAVFRSTAVCNPVSALLTQSKRFPLSWPRLTTDLPTWRALLPETRALPETTWPQDGWIAKPAFGHEGAGILGVGLTDAADLRAVDRRVRRRAATWVAQRRFDMVPFPTPDGPRYACVGVYVVDGCAAGGYARVSPTPLIDDRAQDAVVLVEDE